LLISVAFSTITALDRVSNRAFPWQEQALVPPEGVTPKAAKAAKLASEGTFDVTRHSHTGT